VLFHVGPNLPKMNFGGTVGVGIQARYLS